jgi:biotin operon repressor
MSDLDVRDLVHALLGRGKDNAEPIGALAERTHLTRRQVEEAVQSLRLDGVAVASGNDGVWLGDLEDMVATAGILRGRLISQYRTLRAVRATTARLRATSVDQLALFGLDLTSGNVQDVTLTADLAG